MKAGEGELSNYLHPLRIDRTKVRLADKQRSRLIRGQDSIADERLMKRPFRNSVFMLMCLFGTIGLFGCASVELGRMEPVSQDEVESNTCEGIQAEMTKADEFCAQAISVAFNRADCAVATASDYVPYVGGILAGRAYDKREEARRALRTATIRQSQLRRLAKQRNCLVKPNKHCPSICEDPDFGWTRPPSISHPVAVTAKVDDGLCGLACVTLSKSQLRLIESVGEGY